MSLKGLQFYNRLKSKFTQVDLKKPDEMQVTTTIHISSDQHTTLTNTNL